jgi:pantoate kinase
MKASNSQMQPILRHGSVGAGISIDRGVTTTVSIFDSQVYRFKISINGVPTSDAEVSELVLAQYLRFINKHCYIEVEHDIEIPVGFGLGTSGAAALSLSYALNRCFSLGLTREHAAQIAHYAEVVCGTGLGSVIAEYTGGFECRTIAGPPGLGKIKKTNLEGCKAIILCMNPISTKNVLKKNDFGRSWSEYGVKTPLEVDNLRDFLDTSYAFVSNKGLIDNQSREIISNLSSLGFSSSIALFGRTIFTIVPKDKTERVVSRLSGHRGQLITCGIDNIGARML